VVDNRMTSDRIERVRQEMGRLGVDGLLVGTPMNTAYLSGFVAVTYSRPMMVLIDFQGCRLVIPELEEEHAEARVADGISLHTYSDKDLGGLGGRSTQHLALEVIARLLGEGDVRRLGFESALSYGNFQLLRDAVEGELVPVAGVVEGLRLRKIAAEADRVRQACAVADHGMKIEIDATRPGVSEMEIMAAGDAAMLKLAAEGHPDVVVTVGSRPVSGPNTEIPHSLTGPRRLRAGDVVIHGCGAAVAGYCSEVERTVFIGRPSPEATAAFAAMYRSQRRGFEEIHPGARCCDVDRACRRVLEEAGYGRFILHRTGHGMGLEGHEAPYLSLADETVLEPGMVVSVEPGIYIPGLGGFRHSDTVLVTDAGCEILTGYPRDLEAMIL